MMLQTPDGWTAVPSGVTFNRRNCRALTEVAPGRRRATIPHKFRLAAHQRINQAVAKPIACRRPPAAALSRVSQPRRILPRLPRPALTQLQQCQGELPAVNRSPRKPSPTAVMAAPGASAASPPRLMSSLDGATVLLTGGLGFLGSVTLERLLRLTAVKKVFLLVRGSKKGSARERVSQLLAGPLFHLLHKQPHAFSRLAVVEGDLRLPGLGLAGDDADALRREVSVVLHAAANMDLELHIQETLKCNYCGTQALCELAAQMPRLAAFVHVSTFFVSNHLPAGTRVPERQAAPLPLVLGTTCFASHADFVSAVLALPPDEAHVQVAALMRHWGFASTYGFGKHLTEQLVDAAPLGLKARKVILRPSLISGLAGDPYPGFLSGFAGAPGFVMGYAAGFYEGVASIPFPSESLFDIVPCDCVAALVIAAAAAAMAGVGPSAEPGTAFYHATSADSHPMPIAAGFERLAAFWTANPPPFCLPLTRYVTFGNRPHTPGWLGLAVGRWITGAKVGLVCKLLELAGAAGKARLLRNSFKAFCVQNSEEYGRRMSLVCCVDNARQLRECLQQPDERHAWPLVFDESVATWDEYEPVAFAGARHLLFKVAPAAGSASKYQPKPAATPALVQELLRPTPAAQAAAAAPDEGEDAAAALPDQAAVGGSSKLGGGNAAGAKINVVAAGVRSASLGSIAGVAV